MSGVLLRQDGQHGGEVSAAMRYAVAHHTDGTLTLTVFEDGAACAVDLSAAQADSLADLLTSRRDR